MTLEYQSEKIDELAISLSKAQGNMTVAIEDKKNPHFKSSYASLNSIWDACREALSNEGLSVVQTTEPQEQSINLVTTLMHASGQWIKSILPIPSLQLSPQQLGSALTYLRRYSLSAIVGVAPGYDDDGDTVKNETIPVKKNSNNVPFIPSPLPKAPVVLQPEKPKMTESDIAAFKEAFGIGTESKHEKYIEAIANRCKKSKDEMIILASMNREGFVEAFEKWEADIKKKGEIAEDAKPVGDPLA